LKLPDSIVMATSLYHDLPLVTSDKEFNKVEELQVIYYEKEKE
jgi:predicted nucleic acid-binding protein